jgi:hypothetical protein
MSIEIISYDTFHVRVFMFKKFSLILSIFLFLAANSFAESSSSKSKKQVLKTIKQIEQTQKKLRKQFNKLSAASKAEVIAKTSKKTNSDDDSINDHIEGALGTNKCDDDSDSDGLSDDDEYERGSDPKNDDSNDDGIQDGLEFEVRGLVQSIDSISLKVASVDYVLNGSTQYLDKNKDVVSPSFFSVGKCVEVEGHNIGGSKVVKKIKEDNDC